MKKIGLILAVFWSLPVLANSGLTIFGEDLIIAKFHREDNRRHAYSHSNVFRHFVVPEGHLEIPYVRKNSDGSFTIVYDTLEELLKTIIKISNEHHQSVSVLNIDGHGGPGYIFLPEDEKTLMSADCGGYRADAYRSDQDVYTSYYATTEFDDTKSVVKVGEEKMDYPCDSGPSEWRRQSAEIPQLKEVFSDDVKIHFLTCLTGDTVAGDMFLTSVAKGLLEQGSQGRVEALMTYALGDWSTPNGAEFWYTNTEAQTDHDNTVYWRDKKDAEIAQKGSIKAVSYDDGTWKITVLSGVKFMGLGPKD